MTGARLPHDKEYHNLFTPCTLMHPHPFTVAELCADGKIKGPTPLQQEGRGCPGCPRNSFPLHLSPS